jgi:hypothetical protein
MASNEVDPASGGWGSTTQAVCLSEASAVTLLKQSVVANFIILRIMGTLVLT